MNGNTIPPNSTLYIRGLNERIPKTQLRSLLYCLFSQFGKVLDVVALKTIKMRGQAFVVYGSIEEATAAMRALQGFSFVDNALVCGKLLTKKAIHYAMGRSNILNVVQGTYKASVKPLLKRHGEELEQESGKRSKGDDMDVESDSGMSL